MRRNNRHMLGMALALTAVLGFAASATASASVHQESAVGWHPQQAALGKTGVVSGASASIVRNQGGVSYSIQTNSLDPGSAYTLWLVVINNPAACSADPCSPGDILANAATRSQVRFAGGHVVGGSGNATISGRVGVGPLSGWLTGRELEDPYAADIHLVINDHGPKIPELVSNMISTYRGGCSDSSPFPGIFPASALADGVVGPNICRLSQAATFSAP